MTKPRDRRQEGDFLAWLKLILGSVALAGAWSFNVNIDDAEDRTSAHFFVATSTLVTWAQRESLVTGDEAAVQVQIAFDKQPRHEEAFERWDYPHVGYLAR